MAQRQVVEIACCRCERKEYREPIPDTVEGGTELAKSPALRALLIGENGETVEVFFEDLCTPCINTVKGHLTQIGKKIEGVSPVREKGREKGKKHPLEDLGKPDPTALPHNGVEAKKKGHASA